MTPRDIAELLLDIGCVSFSLDKPYSYASGLKGPIYCDNRKLLGHSKERKLLWDHWSLIIKELEPTDVSIAGIATAGIAHAAGIADRLDRNLIYIRPKAKEHGKMNQVEGDYKTNQKFCLIEDLVNQASSLGKTMDAARLAELTINSVYAIVDYETPIAKKRISDLGLRFESLTTFTVLVDTALSKGLIRESDRDELLKWHSDPQAWSAL